ncbi:MAG: DUF1549 and DUF1553 domain-containing protein [Planctomycetota bacterium]
MSQSVRIALCGVCLAAVAGSAAIEADAQDRSRDGARLRAILERLAGPADRGQAHDPDAPVEGEIDLTEARDHWAFHPPVVETPEVVRDRRWARDDVDRYVRAALEEEGLEPVGDADRRTLGRRLWFDLTGLPPGPEELDKFVDDPAADDVAVGRLVDRLLASPHFGETWGRHWLDVARYAESTGKEANVFMPLAWRYRDYVIASFNADKPIDRFFTEQVAGDLLDAADDTAAAEQAIATGFLALGPKSQNERNSEQYMLDVADEQIDTVGRGMLGLTVACARCHDHEFDPIPTEDYYAMAGIFLSTDLRAGLPFLQNARRGSRALRLPEDADVPLGNTLNPEQVRRIRDRLDSSADASPSSNPAARIVRTAIIQNDKAKLELYDNDNRPRKLAAGVKDRLRPADTAVRVRGEPDKPGDLVRRGFLQVLTDEPRPEIARGQSGRLELAEWITSPGNPLTARVYVNRVWGHLFGRGLVETPDNFGIMGFEPSHPELLDYLAVWFTENGWSTKALIKKLVLTRTYRMSSDYTAANALSDPDNIYLWRMSKRRIPAEAIRDAMLAVSGVLDRRPAEGSPVYTEAGQTRSAERFGKLERMAISDHRSVYLPIVRAQIPESLEVFDFADPNNVTGDRPETSIPSQALYVLNDERVMELAEKFADRVIAMGMSDARSVEYAYRLALGRPPTRGEQALTRAFLVDFARTQGSAASPEIVPRTTTLRTRGQAGRFADRFRGRFDRRPESAEPSTTNPRRDATVAFAQALFATAEFRYLD